MRTLIAFAALIPMTAFAAPYERPIPQAQSATAEFWFFLAALSLLAALAVVARIVARR